MTWPEQCVPFAKWNEQLKKTQQVIIPGHQLPIQPADGTVMTIRIVVALLTASNFVATEQHRHPL